MTWQTIVKRGRSYSKRKKIDAHNQPILQEISNLKAKEEDAIDNLIGLAGVHGQDMYGREDTIKLRIELQKINEEMAKLISKLKSLSSKPRGAFTAE
mgnify:FL=1